MDTEKRIFHNIDEFLKLPQLCEAAQWHDQNGCMLIFSQDTVDQDQYQVSVFENNEALFHVKWNNEQIMNVIAILPMTETEVLLVTKLE